MGKTAADSGRKSTKVLKRELSGTAPYNPENIKHVVEMLSQVNAAASALAKAADTLSSISAHEISPDGMLGGRGYVMSVKDIRADIASAENLVTDLTDTLSDELTNPKWELTPEDIQKYKDQAKSGVSSTGDKAVADTDTDLGDITPDIADAGLPSAGGPDTSAVPDFFGDEAPQSLEPPPPVPEPELAPAPASEPAPAADIAAPQLPFRKLAELVGHPERDHVARALRAPILFNLLDGHTAGI
jgi:hypothetical protein